MKVSVARVMCVVAVIFHDLMAKVESLQIDDGLLKETIESYNQVVPGSLKVVDFKDIQTPVSTYPVSADSRMNVSAVRGNGRRYKTTLLLTEVPSSGFRRALALKSGIFDTCFNVYKYVIPKLDELLLDSGDDSEPLWSTHLASRPQHVIITVNYPHSRWQQGNQTTISTVADYGLLLRNVAKWHAMTAVLLQRNLIPQDLFNTSMTVRNQQRTLTYYKYLLKNFAEVVRASWGDEWSDLVPLSNNLASVVSKRILDAFNHSKSSDAFKVLNLGDFNLRDLSFNFGISDTFESPRPIAVKFSSFERAHINTPAFDVNAVIYTMPFAGTALLENRDSLLATEYHPALLRYLTKFGFAGSPPTLAQLQTETDRTEVFAVLESLSQFAYRESDPAQSDFVEGLEKAWKTGEVKVNMTGMLTGEFAEAIKPITRRVLDKAIFI